MNMKKTRMIRAGGSSSGGKRECPVVPMGSTPTSATNQQMRTPKFWCKRCDIKTKWYTRPSAIPCPFNPIWACVKCERENLMPGDEDLLPKCEPD